MGYTPPYLEVRNLSGYTSVMPPTATAADDLRIYANTTNSLPYIFVEGGGGVTLYLTTAYHFKLVNQATLFSEQYLDGTDCVLESKVNDNNVYLKTNGTGVVKFGTYTAGAATDSTGYITIKDAGGNTRKLMVQA